MYVRIVRPMDQKIGAWRTNLVTVRNNLSKMQRLAAVCITGAVRICTTAATKVQNSQKRNDKADASIFQS